jgi:K+-transporting ATPase c subunit
VIGFALIDREFTSEYFYGGPQRRPLGTPTTPPRLFRLPYNADNSGRSSLEPTNKSLIERVQGDIEKLKQENPSA